ncbi:Melanopsin-B [Vespula maculifrons]|uniref:Melanopsin-B n=1 Tax=Vespula maculifrons TaxID=7453 RepID=A0ABD2CM83_VESMC
MDLGDFERWWKDPGIAVWSFVLFGCFLLNAILFLAFLIRPGLRTISNSPETCHRSTFRAESLFISSLNQR